MLALVDEDLKSGCLPHLGLKDFTGVLLSFWALLKYIYIYYLINYIFDYIIMMYILYMIEHFIGFFLCFICVSSGPDSENLMAEIFQQAHSIWLDLWEMLVKLGNGCLPNIFTRSCHTKHLPIFQRFPPVHGPVLEGQIMDFLGILAVECSVFFNFFGDVYLSDLIGPCYCIYSYPPKNKNMALFSLHPLSKSRHSYGEVGGLPPRHASLTGTQPNPRVLHGSQWEVAED